MKSLEAETIPLSSEKKFRKLACFGAVLSIFFCSPAGAAVISARSLLLADVATAVRAASDGDTVTVPAGSATWSSQLVIGKNIAVIGNGGAPTTCGMLGGTCQTVITENLIDRSASLIAFTLSSDNATFPARLSGFEFRGARISTKNISPVVEWQGKSLPTQTNPAPLVVGLSTIRMDHIEFDITLTSATTAGYGGGLAFTFQNCLGVVDHVTRTGNNEPGQVRMAAWTPPGRTILADNGHGSWADEPYWGSNKFLFFEDCTFTQTPLSDPGPVMYGIDLYQGARCVSRYNTWVNASWGGHGTETGGRGIKQWEVYNDKNSWLGSYARAYVEMRGGSALVHDCTFSGITGVPNFQVYSLTDHGYRWGKADGHRPWDHNVELVASGTHTGPGGAMLQDTGANFPKFTYTTSGFYVLTNRDAPLDSNGDVVKPHVITSNTSTEITGGSSAIARFETGQHYQIWKIKQVLDMPGQGKGALLKNFPDSVIIAGAKDDNGAPRPSSFYTTTAVDCPQRGYPLDPVYTWNNVSTGGVKGSPAAGTQVRAGNYLPEVVQLGRDYFEYGNLGNTAQEVGAEHTTRTYSPSSAPTVMIGPSNAKYLYVPYVYPHPLTRAQATEPKPSPPSNLRVVPGP